MNINPKKVKELILIYSELNEEYQKELMQQAYILRLKQSQLNQIQKEQKTFKSDKDLQEEIQKRANKTAERASSIMDMVDKMGETDIASLMIIANQLSGKGNIIEESDVSITINQKGVSMKEYIEKYLADADYGKAKEKVLSGEMSINAGYNKIGESAW